MKRLTRILLLTVVVATGTVLVCGETPVAEETPPAQRKVVANDSGWRHFPWAYKPYVGMEGSERYIDFLTAGVSYSFRYCAVTDSKLGGKVAWPGLGIGGPYSEQRSTNWYANGFQTLEINGVPIAESRLTRMALLDQGKQGLMEFVWDLPVARVRLRYLVPPEGRYFLLQWMLEPRQAIKSIRLRLSCYPGEFTTPSIAGPGDRIVTTALHDYPQGSHPELDRLREGWVLYADKVMDRARQVVLPKTGRFVKGCAGLEYLPVTGMKVKLDITDYEVATFLDYPPEARDLRLALWEFPTKTNAEGLKLLRDSADSVRGELEQATFLPLTLADFDAAREQQLLTELTSRTRQPTTELHALLKALTLRIASLKSRQGEAASTPITLEGQALGLAEEYAWEKGRLQRAARPTMRVLHLRGLHHYASGVGKALQLLGRRVGKVQVSSLRTNESQTTSLNYVPGTVEEMSQYNVVILDDVDPLALGGTGQGLLCSLMKHGGGLLLVGGFYSYGNSHLRGSPLEECVPVRVTAPFDLLPMTPPAELRPSTGAGLMKGLKWQQHPVSLWQHQLSPRPGAQVLVNAGGKPFLVIRDSPSGRVAACLGSVLGQPSRGATAFWEWESWTTLLERVISWLAGGKQ